MLSFWPVAARDEAVVVWRDNEVGSVDEVCEAEGWRGGELGPGIVDEGCAVGEGWVCCVGLVLCRVRDEVLALWEGGPTKREGAGSRCAGCLDIFFKGRVFWVCLSVSGGSWVRDVRRGMLGV